MPRLRSSALLRNVMAVASGTAAGQVVVFAFSPLITRIYSPEAFGLQGMFLSLISMLSPAIALRYPMAIVVAETDTEARHLARLAMLIAFALSLLLGLLLLLAQGPVLTLLGAEALGALIWFLPLALFCVALQDVAGFHTARAGRFRLVGIVTVTQAFLTNMARVLGGLVAPAAAVLVVVTAVAPSVQAALLHYGHRGKAPAPPRLGRSAAMALMRKHRDFALYRMPTDVLSAVSQSVPVILLAVLFSPVAAGFYILTRSVLNLPSNVIGAAVGNVLYARFAELARDKRPLFPLLFRATLALLCLAPAIIGLTWFAPTAFAFVFGEEWREAGTYAQVMALWVGVSIATEPAIRLAPVIAAQNLMLVASVITLLARILSMYLTFLNSESAIYVVGAYSIASLISFFGLILAIMVLARRYDRTTQQQSTHPHQL